MYLVGSSLTMSLNFVVSRLAPSNSSPAPVSHVQSSGGSWPLHVVGEIVSCSPDFQAPRLDDYRLPGGRGVTWAPRERHFGP